MCSFSAEQTIDWLGMINAAFADIVGLGCMVTYITAQ